MSTPGPQLPRVPFQPGQTVSTSPTPLQTDKWIYRSVVWALGAVAILAALGAIILAYNQLEVPSVLVALGSTALGGLAGLLAPAPPTAR